MPRVSREQADRHRVEIEKAASRLFRERGLNGVSVADLMAEVGLTHGGFYGHFGSKDALAAVACAHAFAQSGERWRKRVADACDTASARADLLSAYLSAQSAKVVGKSCPAPALATDVAREPADAPIRKTYAAGVDDLVRILASLAGTGNAAADRAAALADFSMLVGALVLARATAGETISAEFLAAARDRLMPRADPIPAPPTSTCQDH